jgi:hypothetical protein
MDEYDLEYEDENVQEEPNEILAELLKEEKRGKFRLVFLPRLARPLTFTPSEDIAAEWLAISDDLGG